MWLKLKTTVNVLSTSYCNKWAKSSSQPGAVCCVHSFNQITHTHTHTTILLLFWNMSGTTRVSRYHRRKTRKVKTSLDLLEQEMVNGILEQC